MTRQEAAQAINDLLFDKVRIGVNIKGRDLDPNMSIDDFERICDIYRIIDNSCEIVYYSRALKFFIDNNPSMEDAFELVADYGVDLRNLNSEILATMLNRRYMTDDYYDCRNEIQDILDDIEDED